MQVQEDMPLLWAIRDIVGLTGTKFGCGVSQCGACAVLIDGKLTKSCIVPVSYAVEKELFTIELDHATNTLTLTVNGKVMNIAKTYKDEPL